MDSTTHETADEIVARLIAVIEAVGLGVRRDGITTDALRTLAGEACDALGTIARPPAAAPLVVQADSLMPDLLTDFDQRAAAAAVNGGIVGARTGLDHLDETLNGLQAGQLYVLAAMPGLGKTTLALQMAATVAQSGRSALYLSLENDAVDLARKTVCRLGDVSYRDSLKGKVDRQEWMAAVSRLQRLHGLLYFATPRAAMPTLTSLVEGVMTRTGSAPQLLVVDYLQALVKRGATGGETSDLRERIDRFTPELRALGAQYGCAVLAISSQNRAGYEKGGMSAMKESGDVEYGADVIMTLAQLTPDELKARNYDITHDTRNTPLKLTVDKNRSGLTGRPIPLLLYGDTCKIEEDR